MANPKKVATAADIRKFGESMWRTDLATFRHNVKAILSDWHITNEVIDRAYNQLEQKNLWRKQTGVFAPRMMNPSPATTRNPRKITDLNTKRKYFWFKGWVIEDTWSGWLARPSQLAGDRVKNITWRDTGEDKSDTLRKIKQAITDSGIKGTIPKRVVDDWNEEYARRHDKRRSMYYRKNPDSKLPRGAVNSCQRLLSNSASGAIKAHNLCEKVMRKSTDIASFEKALDHALGAKHSLDNAIARMREEIDAL